MAMTATVAKKFDRASRTMDEVLDVTKEEGAVLDECKDDNVDSREGMFELEGGFPCKQCDQILNNWNELMFHMKSQHAETCNECSRIPGTNSCVGDQTTRGQKFQ